jgi:hypothetical protein
MQAYLAVVTYRGLRLEYSFDVTYWAVTTSLRLSRDRCFIVNARFRQHMTQVTHTMVAIRASITDADARWAAECYPSRVQRRVRRGRFDSHEESCGTSSMASLD